MGFPVGDNVEGLVWSFAMFKKQYQVEMNLFNFLVSLSSFSLYFKKQHQVEMDFLAAKAGSMQICTSLAIKTISKQFRCWKNAIQV